MWLLTSNSGVSARLLVSRTLRWYTFTFYCLDIEIVYGVHFYCFSTICQSNTMYTICLLLCWVKVAWHFLSGVCYLQRCSYPSLVSPKLMYSCYLQPGCMWGQGASNTTRLGAEELSGGEEKANNCRHQDSPSQGGVAAKPSVTYLLSACHTEAPRHKKIKTQFSAHQMRGQADSSWHSPAS